MRRKLTIEDVDFTMPVPVPVVAEVAGIDPHLIHSLKKRAAKGLVEAATPQDGGRFAWVEGPSGLVFVKGTLRLRAALYPGRK